MTPRNIDELATLIEGAIKSENQIGPGADHIIRRVAVSVARHGSRYARHARFADSGRRVSNAGVLAARGVVAHRVMADLSDDGPLSQIINALIGFAARWFLQWLLKRLENRDAVAAIASREVAWLSTEEPTEIDE